MLCLPLQIKKYPRPCLIKFLQLMAQKGVSKTICKQFITSLEFEKPINRLSQLFDSSVIREHTCYKNSKCTVAINWGTVTRSTWQDRIRSLHINKLVLMETNDDFSPRGASFPWKTFQLCSPIFHPITAHHLISTLKMACHFRRCHEWLIVGSQTWSEESLPQSCANGRGQPI